MEIGGMPIPVNNSSRSSTSKSKVYDKSIDTTNLRPTVPNRDTPLGTRSTRLSSKTLNQIVHLRSKNWGQNQSSQSTQTTTALQGFKKISPGLYKNDDGVLAKWVDGSFTFRGFEA